MYPWNFPWDAGVELGGRRWRGLHVGDAAGKSRRRLTGADACGEVIDGARVGFTEGVLNFVPG